MSILDWNGSISLSAAITQARTDGKELYILPGSYNPGFTAIARRVGSLCDSHFLKP